ncbi:MAG: hypothetical protein ACRDGE_00035 [Candidatus Limnocylindria bacterium]
MNGWLEGVFGAVRCANCGGTYARDDVSVVGNRDEYWFIRCACHMCGTQGIGVVIVKETAAPPQAAPPIEEEPLVADDVLVAHEILRNYIGDVHGLFESGIAGR